MESPEPKARGRFGGLGRRLLVAGSSIVAVLVLTEVALRVASAQHLRRLAEGIHSQREADPGRTVILAIGESTTGGFGVGREETYPKQLEVALRRFYENPAIDVIRPLHLGQNSSQILNRLDDHLELHEPKLVILMCGVNNEWSLAESNIADFLPENEVHTIGMRLASRLDRLKVFKLARFAYLAATKRAHPLVKPVVLGQPEMTPFPPPADAARFAASHSAAFVRLWRHDLTEMIRKIRRRGADVLLMTYPNYDFSYLKSEEFVRLAGAENVRLVRNDLSFKALIGEGRQHEFLLADGAHPTALGYAVVAENARTAIREYDLLGFGDPPGRAGAAPESK